MKDHITTLLIAIGEAVLSYLYIKFSYFSEKKRIENKNYFYIVIAVLIGGSLISNAWQYNPFLRA